MPSFLKVVMSTADRIDDTWSWQPDSFGSCSNACFAFESDTAHMDNAIRTSSVWRRGFLLPRYPVFKCWIGSIKVREIRCVFLLMFPSTLIAFNNTADAGPSRSEVEPVTIVPSGSSEAAAAEPFSCARLFATGTTARSLTVIFACFMISSCLYTSSLVASSLTKRFRDW